MRFFIGISFKQDIILKLAEIQEELKAYSIKGRFTLIDNFHLTLVFLGEIDESRILFIEESIRNIEESKFCIETENLGTIKRRNEEIFWLGIKKNAKLNQIQEKLTSDLLDKGFKPDERVYKPHITLGRNIIMNSDFNPLSVKIPKLTIEVDKINLMKSHRVNGILTYTPVIIHLLKN